MIGQINSHQNHIQPPQNPLLAMTNLSTSPLSVGSTSHQTLLKENIDHRNTVSSVLATQVVPNTTLLHTNSSTDTNSSTEPTNILSPVKVNIPKTSSDGNV